ncbi:MAG: EamA family transporter [Sphingomonas sp.]|uniref:DMT family transporter n=1 Tax=Sphingomonas sp. TaxID=28214 RepID=UPI001AD3E709|nr:DMT family transporter [Sphingomonas sp.]MBN8808650.1 EamA family transporter [Sphingomonas sp.]
MPKARSFAGSSRRTASPSLTLVALVVGNVALAFGPLFVRMADVGPVAAAFWRLALAAPVLVVAAVASGWRPGHSRRGVLWAVAIGGLCFAVDLASWHVGIRKTSMTNATLFGNSASLIFPLYGFVVARAWPSRTQGLALVLALVGAMLLMGRSLHIAPEHFAGDLLCVLAGIFYTLYFAVMARARDTMPPVPALAASTLASLGPLLLIALAMGEQVVPQQWGPLIALALVSQVVGQSLMIFALGQASPLIVGIMLLIQPIVGSIIGAIGYGERLDTIDWLGAGLVGLALVLVRRTRSDTAELAPEGVEKA